MMITGKIQPIQCCESESRNKWLLIDDALLGVIVFLAPVDTFELSWGLGGNQPRFKNGNKLLQ